MGEFAKSMTDSLREGGFQSCRPPEIELRTRLRDLANERRRFGYRRLFILLRREGEASGINRIYRLYREEGLAVCKRRARRKAIGTRAPILVDLISPRFDFPDAIGWMQSDRRIA